VAHIATAKYRERWFEQEWIRSSAHPSGVVITYKIGTGEQETRSSRSTTLASQSVRGQGSDKDEHRIRRHRSTLPVSNKNRISSDVFAMRLGDASVCP